MANNKALLAGLQAYKANPSGIGDPTTGIPSGKQLGTNKTNLDSMASLRDNIGVLVGSGYTGKGPISENQKGYVASILNSMPQAEAQNLLSHIAIQNQTPGVALLNPTQRLQRFYDQRSSIPATDAIIQKVKSLGTGPISAFSETPDVTNQQLANTVAKK